MQVYTKILLGMAVGAAIGLGLGPKAAWLERDLYRVRLDPGSVDLRLDPDQESTRLPLPPIPPGAQLVASLPVLDQRVEARIDAQGESHEVPTWAKVEFEYGERLAVLDKGGVLSLALGGLESGQSAPVWLRLDATAVDGGGWVVRPEPVSALGFAVIEIVRPFGTLFMRLINMVIVPLVFASLLVGVAGLGDLRKLGRLGVRTLALYLVTTAIAVGIGLAVAHVLDPGSFVGESDRTTLVAQFSSDAAAKATGAANAPSAIDNLLDIVPKNPVASLAEGNMLQIIFFALIFGIALTLMGVQESALVVSFFDKVQQAMIIVIHMVMAVAPIGVAALVADVVGTSGFSILGALLVYGVAVILGLVLHVGATYGLMVRFMTRVPLLDFIKVIRPAQLIAFSTSSSSATLPVTMECAEKNLNISNGVASFVLPLGATVNMDGTALYQGVAALFIAQVFQIDLSVGDQLGIVLTATMASIGAAGVPGAGMITLAMVLTAAGIPTVGVALILGIDRILDMFRTTVNVTGDLVVAAVMATAEGEMIRPKSEQE